MSVAGSESRPRVHTIHPDAVRRPSAWNIVLTDVMMLYVHKYAGMKHSIGTNIDSIISDAILSLN